MTVTGDTQYVRGETIEMSWTFTDSDGASATPSGVTVYVHYFVDNVATTATETLSLVSGAWTGTWDSSVADPGTVDMHLRTTGGSIAAEDWRITLKANDANP